MMAARKFSIWFACWLVGMSLVSTASEFVPPAEGPVAFRRDKVPLDPDAMASLARSLVTLANAMDAHTPGHRRAAAQWMALALALDPANGDARELMLEYQEDRHKPFKDAASIEKSRAKVWQYLAWLDTPEAGSHGQALAACMKDVIVVSDPENPKAAALRDAGEKGAWAGWVPPVSAYEPKVEVAQVEPEKSTPATDAPSSSSEVRLAKASLRTLIWQKLIKKDNGKETTEWKLALAPLQMAAEMGGDVAADRPFSVVVGSNADGGSLTQLNNTLRSLLKNQQQSIPHGVLISITSRELEAALESKQRISVSAAAAVLASSALTGHEPDAIILGQVDETGAFKLPSGFWGQIQSLGKGNGQRLILPAQAAAILPSMLALENPGFFMEYEVLLAEDFKQLLALSAKTPEAPLASAHAEFQRIQERLGTQDLRQYIANSFVKQRLSAILQDVPTHFSAKMLLIQAAGSRPTQVVRPVLATEIRRAMEPVEWIAKLGGMDLNGSDMPSSTKINHTYDACRTKVDALERYVEKNDRDLMDHARDVIMAIRNADRASRTRGDEFMIKNMVMRALNDLKDKAREFNKELATASGDANPNGGNAEKRDTP